MNIQEFLIILFIVFISARLSSCQIPDNSSWLPCISQSNSSNLKDSNPICLIHDVIITFNTNLTDTLNYTGYDVSIKNSTITCSESNCQLNITVSSLIILDSTLNFTDIYINVADTLQISSSNILVNSTYTKGKGLSNNTEIGNGYGGYCNTTNNSNYYYGTYDKISDGFEDEETIGSGTPNSPGGGRIVIITKNLSPFQDTVEKISFLNASGSSPLDCESIDINAGSGGTGGYIYLKVSGAITLQNFLQFDVSGGNGCPSNHLLSLRALKFLK